MKNSFRNMKYVLFGLIFLSIIPKISAQQDPLDSLWKEFKKAGHDTSRIKLYFDIGYIYEFSYPDSALLIYKKAGQLADKNIGKQSFTLNEMTRKMATLKATSIMYIGIVEMDLGNFQVSVDYSNIAKAIFEELDDMRGVSNCLNNIAIDYQEMGRLEDALAIFFQSLKELEKIGDKKGIARNYNNIGIILSDQGYYNEALEYYQKSLKIKEQLGDQRGIAQSYNNIGIIHKEIGNTDKAIEYYKKSSKISADIGDKRSVSNCQNNIANIYNERAIVSRAKGNDVQADKESDTAIEYYLQSLKTRHELVDKQGIAHSYGNIASVYSQRGDYSLALEFYTKTLTSLEEIGDISAISGAYGNLSSLYIMMSEKSEIEGKGKNSAYLAQAVKYGLLGYQIADTLGILPIEAINAKTLMNAYKQSGNFAKSVEFAEIFMTINDSLYSQDKTKALADAEKKFESEKKQLQIEKLNKEKELQQSEILRQLESGRRQKLIIFVIVFGLLIVIVFAVFVVNRLRITRRQKRIIEEQKAIVEEKNELLNLQNEEIRSQRDEIESQRDEIATQRDTVIVQRDFIEDQKKAITDSINYAKRIQQAMLPHFRQIAGSQNMAANKSDYKLQISDYFIYYMPKDIVSGDFYWATRVNDRLTFAVADCTGHGVPGAFMSMLGISFLNEIVRKKEISKASDILDELRKSVIEALQQKDRGHDVHVSGSELEVKDGMDISLCVVDLKTGLLQFAGANNPLYILKAAATATVGSEMPLPTATSADNLSSNTLIELKGDKQPVGIHVKMHPFTNQEIMLEPGDCLYLTSDGYADQFGGDDNRKFKTKQLREMFETMTGKAMTDQYDMLKTTFETWKGNHKQIDDVTVVGIKL